jgi:AraC-like DNA-binding protein
MDKIKDLESVNDYCAGFSLSALHPLVSVVDLSEGTWAIREKSGAVRYHFYAVFLKQGQDCILKYGRQNYDFQDGTLVFLGPGQIVNLKGIDTSLQPSGHALLFHPDLLRGSNLSHNLNQYSFFSYEIHEALHISQRERQIVLDCFEKIHYELSQGIDKHSKRLIVSNIELFLNYCDRFYDRQFITREHVCKGVLEKFERLLNGYYSSDKPQKIGLPSVAYFAEELHLSANYFGDLIKKETGKPAKEFIQDKIIDLAKSKTLHTQKTMSEIAFELGFKYPQHFTRFFKQRVGCTPNEYRNLN